MNYPDLSIAQAVEPLIDEERLAARVRELGARIARDHAGQELVLVGILKGSFLFLADLCRCIDLQVSIDFLGVSSYGDGDQSSGVVKITSDLSRPVEGRHVLLVEDIIDTGLTMRYLLSNLATRRPASVKVCALLHKPARTRVEVGIDYLGFTVPDRFVVGYGLDDAGRLRNLPFIGVRR